MAGKKSKTQKAKKPSKQDDSWGSWRVDKEIKAMHAKIKQPFKKKTKDEHIKFLTDHGVDPEKDFTTATEAFENGEPITPLSDEEIQNLLSRDTEKDQNKSKTDTEDNQQEAANQLDDSESNRPSPTPSTEKALSLDQDDSDDDTSDDQQEAADQQEDSESKPSNMTQETEKVLSLDQDDSDDDISDDQQEAADQQEDSESKPSNMTQETEKVLSLDQDDSDDDIRGSQQEAANQQKDGESDRPSPVQNTEQALNQGQRSSDKDKGGDKQQAEADNQNDYRTLPSAKLSRNDQGFFGSLLWFELPNLTRALHQAPPTTESELYEGCKFMKAKDSYEQPGQFLFYADYMLYFHNPEEALIKIEKYMGNPKAKWDKWIREKANPEELKRYQEWQNAWRGPQETNNKAPSDQYLGDRYKDFDVFKAMSDRNQFPGEEEKQKELKSMLQIEFLDPEKPGEKITGHMIQQSQYRENFLLVFTNIANTKGNSYENCKRAYWLCTDDYPGYQKRLQDTKYNMPFARGYESDLRGHHPTTLTVLGIAGFPWSQNKIWNYIIISVDSVTPFKMYTMSCIAKIYGKWEANAMFDGQAKRVGQTFRTASGNTFSRQTTPFY